MPTKESWYLLAKEEAEKGIPTSERFVSIVLALFSVLMVVYLVSHQRMDTGFFTEKFGSWEMVMLYGFWGFWIATSGLEGIFGLRFLSRVVDVFGGLILATVALTWLLIVFPFEFAYFPDVLPESLRFLVAWISNEIARVLMVLGIIIHLGAAIYSPIAYKFIGN